MKVELKIPNLGESITTVTIGTILRPSGSEVKIDEEVVEVETDKVNQVLYAPSSGVIEYIVHEGDSVAIGQIIAYIETSGVLKEEKPSKIEPIVSKVSQEPGVRVSKEEWLVKPQEPAMSKTTKIVPSVKRESRKKLSELRKTIALRMLEVQANTAMLTTFNEVDMSKVINERELHKDTFFKEHGVKLGYMSFFVKVCSSALKAFPIVNSYIDGSDLVTREYIDISIAVATEKGVFVPVIRDADQKSFVEIEREIDDYSERAKQGKITRQDLEGGGFTITNGGVFGSLLSTPMLNPPQSAILGMHKISKRAVVINDQIVIRPIMYLALTYDHRVLDGKEAVQFLMHSKNMLEDPGLMLLET